MRAAKLVWACLVVAALAAAPALAQEGHPLKGSWLGDWGPSATDRNPIFIVMDWDGKNVTGMINPGTDNIPLKNVTLILPPPRVTAPAGGGGGGGGRGARGAAGAAPAGEAAPAAGGGGRGGQGGAAAAGAPAAGGGGRGGQGGAAAAGAPAAGGGGRGGQGGAAAAGAPAAGGGGRGGQQGGAAAAPAPPPPPQDWMVHFEADAKDRSGNTITYVVDGKIENLGLYNRSLVGTWSHGTVKGDFRVQRQ